MSHVVLLDASFAQAVVAIADVAAPQHHIAAARVLTEHRRHAEQIIPTIHDLLITCGATIHDVVAVGVGVGPGSYIGIRTAIASAMGIAVARAVPLRGWSSLDALCLSAGVDVDFAVVPAKRGHWYVALRGQPSALVSDVELVTWWAAHADAKGVSVSNGRAELAQVVDISRVGFVDAIAPAALWAQFAARGDVDETSTLRPDYVRAPDAALPKRDPAWQRDAVHAMLSSLQEPS
jgi:tRNA threonylcarbamoyl adenosine modification protein YeaZ